MHLLLSFFISLFACIYRRLILYILFRYYLILRRACR